LKNIQIIKILRNSLIAIALLLLGSVAVMGQDDPGADEWARTQMTSTVYGGTGLFNTFSPRSLHRGELTFGVFYNNFKRDPGELDINQIPVNITVGLGHRFEAFINADFFQQVTSRSPFLLSGPGFSIPRLLDCRRWLSLDRRWPGQDKIREHRFSRDHSHRGVEYCRRCPRRYRRDGFWCRYRCRDTSTTFRSHLDCGSSIQTIRPMTSSRTHPMAWAT